MYKGSLGRSVMTGEAKRAYMLWECQRDRCYNKKRKFYKYYGGKGIQVIYSSRDFVNWWLKNIKKLRNFKEMVLLPEKI